MENKNGVKHGKCWHLTAEQTQVTDHFLIESR